MLTQSKPASLVSRPFEQCRGFLTTASLDQNRTYWKQREKYTIRPIGMKKTGGRDHTGRVPCRGFHVVNKLKCFCWQILQEKDI